MTEKGGKEDYPDAAGKVEQAAAGVSAEKKNLQKFDDALDKEGGMWYNYCQLKDT